MLSLMATWVLLKYITMIWNKAKKITANTIQKQIIQTVKFINLFNREGFKNDPLISWRYAMNLEHLNFQCR